MENVYIMDHPLIQHKISILTTPEIPITQETAGIQVIPKPRQILQIPKIPKIRKPAIAATLHYGSVLCACR